MYLIYNKQKSVRNVGTIDKITAESELLCQSTLSLGKNIPPLIVKHIYSTNLVSELWGPKKSYLLGVISQPNLMCD